MAVRRWAACRHTTRAGPSSDRAGDLLAPVGRQAVQHDASSAARSTSSASSTVNPAKAAAARARSSSWPIDVHTSV